MKAHLYGTSPYVPDAPFIDADELSRQSGGNTGNLMFCYAISRMIDTGTSSIPWGTDVAHLEPSANCLVMPLANQLGPHVDLARLAEKLRGINIPLVGVGLGAQGPIAGVTADSVPEGSWEWLRVLSSKAATDRPNISLRGQVTYNVIASKGLAEKCVVTGCPSNMINPSPTLGREINRRRANGLTRVVVTAGNPFLPQFKKLEQSLVSLLEQGDGMYVCQHPIDMLRLQRQEYGRVARETFHRYRHYIHPDLNDDSFMLWFRRWAHSFTSVPEWLAILNRYDVVVGTRIHGVMAGIQAGLPSLCLCIDSRTLELCQTMMVPHADANQFRDGITPDQIHDILRQWNWRSYDDNRQVLAQRFVQFFKDNGLNTIDGPRQILSADNLFRTSTSVSRPPATAYCSIEPSQEKLSSIFAALQRSLDKVSPRVLVFGCSDGFEINSLAQSYFHHAEIYGCDVDVEALRIAQKHNAYPSRVHIIGYQRDMLLKISPFDAIVSIRPVFRASQTQEALNARESSPFNDFAEAIGLFTSLLCQGGVLCLYDAEYCISDTPYAERYQTIDMPDLIAKGQVLRILERTKEMCESQNLTGGLFKKIGSMLNE